VDQTASGEYVEPRQLPLASGGARWLIAAAVLGSGMALLDGTVVNVALPTIGRELHAGLTDQQWVLDGYLLTLSALLLSGGRQATVMAAAGSLLLGWWSSPRRLSAAVFHRPLAG
jgi:MFS family permease